MDVKLSGKLLNVAREAVISVTAAENLLVVKTIGDSASVVSGAIEQLGMSEILGVLADKSTVLIVCADSRDANMVSKRISELL